MVGGWFCVAVGSTDTPPRGFLYAACAPPARGVISDGRNRRSVCALIMLIN